jgi:hypothetical protein
MLDNPAVSGIVGTSWMLLKIKRGTKPKLFENVTQILTEAAHEKTRESVSR